MRVQRENVTISSNDDVRADVYVVTIKVDGAEPLNLDLREAGIVLQILTFILRHEG